MNHKKQLQEKLEKLLTWNLEFNENDIQSLSAQIATMETKSEASRPCEAFLSIFLQVNIQDKAFTIVPSSWIFPTLMDQIPLCWIFRINRFFNYHRTSEDQIMTIASFFYRCGSLKLVPNGCITMAR